MNGFTRGAWAVVTVAVVAGTSLGLGATAAAQSQSTREVTAYFATVDRDDAVIRAGGNDLMYPVLKLAKGAVLRVDGETADVQGRAWARVSLPPGSYVLVPADAVSLDAGGRSGVLSKLAKVKLPNMSNARGSWQDATPVALASGTKVSIVGQEPETGAAVNFRITPPEQARGFVLTSQLRRATQVEIDGLMSRSGTSEMTQGTAVPAAAPAATPAAAPASTTTSAPVSTQAAGTTGAPAGTPAGTTTGTPAGTSLAEPMVITPGTPSTGTPSGAGATGTPSGTPGDTTPVAPAPTTPSALPSAPPAPVTTPAATPSTAPVTTPATTPTVAPTGGGSGAVTPSNSPAATPAARPAAPANPYERLETALASVRKQPMESAEYSELAGQYAAEIAKLPETPGNAATRARLQQRLDWLNIMKDLQAKRRANAENLTAITQGQSSLSTVMADMARNRQYTVVGRLTTSTLYDGTRLPKMLRVQAISGGGPRTLAYVRPESVAGIEGKVGQVVGIVGEQAMDASLNLNIITPSRVDVLEAGAPAVPAASPAAGTVAVPAGN